MSAVSTACVPLTRPSSLKQPSCQSVNNRHYTEQEEARWEPEQSLQTAVYLVVSRDVVFYEYLILRSIFRPNISGYPGQLCLVYSAVESMTSCAQPGLDLPCSITSCCSSQCLSARPASSFRPETSSMLLLCLLQHGKFKKNRHFVPDQALSNLFHFPQKPKQTWVLSLMCHCSMENNAPPHGLRAPDLHLSLGIRVDPLWLNW